MSQSTTSAEFFEQKYRENPDPWDFAQSVYELSRYDAIIAALHGQRYERAFEPGCSVGELTRRLAALCTHLDAMDISSTAVEQAQQRCFGLTNVSFHVGALPHHMTEDAFDLIVFSEIGYYFDEANLERVGDALVRTLRPTGTLLAAHWLGTSKDHLLGGDRVHEILRGVSGLELQHSERHEGFRLDRWTRL